MENYIKFIDEQHEKRYAEMLGRMGGKSNDPYRKSVAYLAALDPVVFAHIEDIFSFEDSCIRPDNFNQGWQTSTSFKTTRLMFNLWNGRCSDGETYTDQNGEEKELPSAYYAVDEIFSNAAYAPYFFEAVKIRFEYNF